MTKLKSIAQHFCADEVLTREQMKKVGGGQAPAGGGDCCYSWIEPGGGVGVGIAHNSSQSGCQTIADNLVTSGQASSAHYDFNCDGV